MEQHNYFVIALILILTSKSLAYTCNRTPEKAEKPGVNGDKYIIEVSGNPKGYTPKERYKITLKVNPHRASENGFTQFTLIVEPADIFNVFDASVGKLDPIDSMFTKFTSKCPNAVIETNTFEKKSVDVSWQAPPENSGCVAIKATVIESFDNWYIDDGNLTKILCEDDSRSEDESPLVLADCYACAEAKYEMAFEGTWSRNTHPKDYPANMWITKFSDMVGASHKYEKSFWNMGDFASAGLKLLAEEGDTEMLETELKEQLKNDEIRTIIKARELSYPNVTGTSYTVFRVDTQNHLISLVSKITPSPDWIVGTTNLELCLPNGTWRESYTFNLYPVDIGTDDGLSYNSTDSPTEPQQPIRLITSSSPNNEESPFYSITGEKIKPMAKLHLTRQKLYEKECSIIETSSVMEESESVEPSTISSNSLDSESHILSQGADGPVVDCAVSEWSPWSSCSATKQCGRGETSSVRHIELHPQNGGRSCPRRLTRTKKCKKPCNEDVDCVMGTWSHWSPCSSTCGDAQQQRTRSVIKDFKGYGKKCDSRIQYRKCRLPTAC